MILSEEEKTFLIYCGKEENYSPEEFEKLLKFVNQRLNNALTFKDDDNGLDERKRSEQMLEMALSLFVTSSSKENLDYTSFCSLFYELNWNAERIKKLWSLFDENNCKIRWNLTSSTTHPPQIIDIKWKLDYVMKSFGEARKNSLCYVIKLTVEHCPYGRISFVTFSCSLAQMTSLLTNLRQATRCIKNYSSNAGT